MLGWPGAWIREFRLLFLLFAAVPLATGSIVAYLHYPGLFSWPYFGVSLAAILLLHAGTIALNDYFDFRTGADVINRERTPFTGGTGLLVDGTLRPVHVLYAGLCCFMLCIALGMLIVLARSPIILLFGVIGVGLGAFYTAPPLRLAYRLLGEITWLVSFPLTALGALFVQAPPLSVAELVAMQPAIAAAVASIMPVALLATAGFLVLEFPDYRADRAAGKLGLAVLAGRRKAIGLFALACLLAYASLVGAVLLGLVPAAGLSALITVPLFLWVGAGLLKYYETPAKLVPYIAVGAGAIYLTGILIMISLLIS
jgi:1,4-dihydroxy-2-naphthoate octaprenyltransferase